MPSWAKLYPGAVVTESSSSTLLGLTSWKATYTVRASPAEVDNFYQAIAMARGFNDTQSLAGLHEFRQDSTHDDFRYMVASDAGVAPVYFEARTFGRTPS